MKTLSALTSVLAALCLGGIAWAQPNAAGAPVATESGALQGVTLPSVNPSS